MIHDIENYEIVPLTEEEEGIIEEKIMEYANAMAPSQSDPVVRRIAYSVFG